MHRILACPEFRQFAEGSMSIAQRCGPWAVITAAFEGAGRALAIRLARCTHLASAQAVARDGLEGLPHGSRPFFEARA